MPVAGIAIALLVAAASFGWAQPADAAATDGSGNGAVAEFRQQLPLGRITGDPEALAQRILSTTRYQVTPGDAYRLQVQTGSQSPQTFPLVLQDDYELEVPFIGRLNVEGRLFADVRREVLDRIKAQVPVRFVSFTLASPALFDVTVFGGVTNPGIYTATPLSRVSDVLTVAGGIQRGATLRSVELMRNDAVQVLDLTRFSTLGELDANPTLAPNDRIRVPRAQRPVRVTGEVAFASVYDLLPEEGIDDLLRFAGGMQPGADPTRLSITRTGEGKSTVLRPAVDDWPRFALMTGDVVDVPAVARPEQMVTVQGALFGSPISGDEPVQIPTTEILAHVPFRSGLTVLNVLDAFGGPTPLARAEKSTVRRAASATLQPIDVAELWVSRSDQLDVELSPGDRLHVPIQNLVVYIGGEVNSPIAVPYSPSFTVADYLRAAGGLTRNGAPRFTLIDNNNRRSVVGLGAVPPPGSTLVAAESLWGSVQRWFANITIVTAFVLSLVEVYNAVVGVIP